jgi:CheY-like chemotaxis protein
MFSLYLKKHGFDVTTASDGLAGFSQATQRRFDVIVADLNMPRMDGWGMLRRLRDDFITRETPVAFLSCHDDYRDSLKALDAGAQAYFPKSSRLDAIAVQVREILVPRVQFRSALAKGAPISAPLAQVGPQWAARELCAAKVRGRLDAKDAWATFQLFFRDGDLIHAVATAGRHTADGERALLSYVSSRGAQARFTFGEFPSPRSLTGAAEDHLAACAKLLNENEERLRDGLMVAGKDVHVNAELYALYAQVGPKSWREVARMLCEEKLPPREVIARSPLSPVEVEEAVRDLIRRGVIRLSA